MQYLLLLSLSMKIVFVFKIIFRYNVYQTTEMSNHFNPKSSEINNFKTVLTKQIVNYVNKSNYINKSNYVCHCANIFP